MENLDSDSNLRFGALNRIVETFLKKIEDSHGSLFFEVKYDPSKLNAAVSQYYSDLQTWKNFFQVPDRLDRHKVAALSAHYFLMNAPVTLIRERTDLAILNLINEVLAWHICLSRLKSYNAPIRLKKEVYATFLHVAKKHRESASRTEDISQNHLTLRFFSVFAFLMEENHLLKVAYSQKESVSISSPPT